MKKTAATLMAVLALALATGNANNSTVTPTPAPTATPAPTPIPVAVQGNSDMVLVAQNVPAAVIEAIRQSVVTNPAFNFPTGQAGRPVKSIMISVTGTKATARIVLGP